MKENEFKGSSVEEATQIGLESLGLTKEEADISIIKEGGIFSKAAVSITPKEGEEKPIISEAHAYLNGILSHMNLQVAVEEKIQEDEIYYYISGENASGAIGHRGDTLDAIQYLVSQYINKDNDAQTRKRVVIDADFYREKRKRTLVSLAKRLAKEADATHKEIELEPMNSYERRIIHSALQDNEEATTRSEGEGRDRHIIITPKNGLLAYGNSDFKKTGPSRTRSFGYNKKRF
ncbi:MAG TPA: RNA-binding cell elongation regulator Jag/EloR [Clostridia bacterium]|nr:RNA-binding cell elongation regulator Jag/EloR [Clostridia bacterium]